MPGGGTFHFTGRKAGLPPRPAGVIVGRFCPIASRFALRISKQRLIRAAITSILVGGKFIKVNLSVFDNDGMEGFYVPESAFRDFVKDAGASTVQQNISFESDGYGSGISGEAVALQALQNMYNSATSALSSNIRKNKAKIKYNTIVYLINSDEAR